MVKGPLTLPLAVQFIWTLTDSLYTNGTTLSLSIRLHSHPYERSRSKKKKTSFLTARIKDRSRLSRHIIGQNHSFG
uniref:Putative secreted protein n=1 Tax=Anopheles marajoara TaxID=58244 RepID=A0A2M4CD40_9DIPT